MHFKRVKKQQRGRKDGIGLDAITPSPNGYLVVLSVFASLAVLAIVLMALYRKMPKPTETLDRQKRANAQYVSFAIVFSNVHDSIQRRAIADIIADIGPDSAVTDFVVGSTVADPWVASIHEYKYQLRRAMTTTKPIPIGKQSMIMSMVAGLIAKNDLPARVYVIGNLNGEDRTDNEINAVMGRTMQTMATLAWRNSSRAPVSVYNYMDTTTSALNAQYVRIMKSQRYPYSDR